MENSTNNQIKKTTEKSSIEISRLMTSDFQKEGTMTAELKQTITTKSYYPSKSVANSLQANPFSMEEFGFEEKEFENKETRVAWIDVPASLKIEEVKAKLDAMQENTSLYRILSNKPILSDTEKYAIENVALEATIDTFANKQIVRFPDSHEKAGQIAVDLNGKIQYRRVAFSMTSQEDSDLRTAEMDDVYMSEEIKAEINETVAEDQAI